MADLKFYNVKKVSLAFVSDVSGFNAFSAINSGVDMEGSVSFEFASDQVVLKEDWSGNHAVLSQKNSRSCNMTLSVLPGTPLNYYLSNIHAAQKAADGEINLSATFLHPRLNKRYQWKGLIAQEPSITVQGELEPIEYNLIGIADDEVIPDAGL